MFARANTRKHKKWEGDGFLTIHANGETELTEECGREIARSTFTSKKRAELSDGHILMVGGYEVEIQEEVDALPVSAPVQPPTPKKIPSPVAAQAAAIGRFKSAPSFKRTFATASACASPAAKRRFEDQQQPAAPAAPAATAVLSPMAKPRPFSASSLIKSASSGSAKPFCSPLVGNRQQEKVAPMVINEREVERGATPILLEGWLAAHLREHQKQGVAFLVDKLKSRGGGAILADDMGLGKSIQTIATCWTLLKRKTPKVEDGVRKVLVVVPSSLLHNWRAEFAKWFRATRTPAMLVRKVSDIGLFASAHKITPFLVVSYDMALRYAPALSSCQFDLLVCDEGHRLKNASGKLREALCSLSIPRRLLLTGTPVQNDLDEFHSLLDFVLPGNFGTPAEFRSLCREGGEEEGGGGEGDDSETSPELARLHAAIGECMLRRTSEVNVSHLPDKHEYVLFCAASKLQIKIFEAIADHVTGEPLVLIDQMRKASNHPAILYKHLQKGNADSENTRVSYSSILSMFPRDFGSRTASVKDSGKLSVLVDMLVSFREHGECTVIVSQYTKTLDMIAILCSTLQFRIYRLDGSTPVADRQKLVNDFNQSRDSTNIFLLSSKAGGVGLNLIGASRLVLFDLDWNPASDLQAMARIWRDGQPRACHIYRLVTTGTIDEKILQRQIKKTGLAAIVNVVESLNGQTDTLSFRDEDLKDIFTFKETASNTHDLLECACGGDGLLPLEREEEEEVERAERDDIDEDEIAASVVRAGGVETTTVSIDDGEDTVGEGEEEEDTAELPTEPASMAELFRWRHYAPNNDVPWQHLKAQAGLGKMGLEEVTFALHYCNNF
ncbi:hypothetical protein PRIPAC_78181 [Pristionchus pacificus]|uniref:DNA repair and recombination protein RAD54-like n=1 Tax=Pristionchus pacificus TaxID=54126 RepID=A0A2A6BHK0_PRIPA|nr:hypothetical protein PRIPAC_78181 [Pristionchus pacificus]|eukprot:PDM65380.1 helicase [Pristionchus pacificus]